MFNISLRYLYVLKSLLHGRVSGQSSGKALQKYCLAAGHISNALSIVLCCWKWSYLLIGLFLFCYLPEERIKVFYICWWQGQQREGLQNNIVQFSSIQGHGGSELAGCRSLKAFLSGSVVAAGRKLKFISSLSKVKRLLACKALCYKKYIQPDCLR